jgi:peptidoglycan hydrolase-like protein with peptidoglycan-binding domain
MIGPIAKPITLRANRSITIARYSHPASSRGLSADGIVGASTWTALIAVTQ